MTEGSEAPEVDPVTFFSENDIGESRVLSIRHYDTEARFEIVLSYANIRNILIQMQNPKYPHHIEGPYRTWEYFRLTFEGVRSLRRAGTLYKDGFLGFQRHSLDYDHRRAITVEIDPAGFRGVTIRRLKHRFRARISMGSVGVYHFSFSRLLVDRRAVIRDIRETPPIARDTKTGEEVDREAPFG